MKIRIKGNSIRLRLSQAEVTELVVKGQVMDTCEFIGAELVYGIYSRAVDRISAEMYENKISVVMPSEDLKAWDTDTRIGFEDTMENGTFILVEKDFKCLVDRTNEDESNLYPNPLAKN
jgi:hypothetical protein